MKIRDIIAIIIGLFLFVFLFGSVYTVELTAPDNAVVYVDAEKKIYYAPPRVDITSTKNAQSVDPKRLKASTLKEVSDLNYQPDQISQEKGYFTQKYRSFTGYLLEKAGLLKPLPPRWNKDGAWNW